MAAKTTEDWEREFAELMEADACGRCDGDGPADVAPVEEVDHGEHR